jgi:hypothetical protein
MSVRPDVGLERVIHGLERELLAAPDEEFVAGARDLGMNPDMKGSAAFVGVKGLSPQLLAAARRAYLGSLGGEETNAGEETRSDPAEPDRVPGTAKGNADA